MNEDLSVILNEVLKRNSLVLGGEPALLQRLIDHLAQQPPGPSGFNALVIILLRSPHRQLFQTRIISLIEDWLPDLLRQGVWVLSILLKSIDDHPDRELSWYIKTWWLYPVFRGNLLNFRSDLQGVSLALRSNDPELKGLALLYLDRFKANYYSLIVRAWVDSRDPKLEEMIFSLPWQSLLTDSPDLRTWLGLKTGCINELGSLANNQIKIICNCCKDRDPQIASNALAVLHSLDEASLDQVVQIWMRDRIRKPNQVLLDLLKERKYQPRYRNLFDRRHLFGRWVILVLALDTFEEVANLTPGQLPDVLKLLQDKDPVIVEKTWQLLGRLTNSKTQEALCQVVMERNWPELEQIVLQAGYEPPRTPYQSLVLFADRANAAV